MSDRLGRGRVQGFLEEVRVVARRQRKLLSDVPPVAPSPESQRELLEELRVDHEELRVAEEELLAQVESVARVQHQLATERQRYIDLFRHAADAYVVTDADGVIREANLAAAHLFEREPRFLVGKPLIVLCSPAGIAPLHDAIARAMADLSEAQQVFFRPRKGEPCFASVRATRLLDEGALIWSFPSSSHEAPPSRRSGLYSAYRPDAEQASPRPLMQELGFAPGFLSILAHDLRGPLSAVLGWTQLLQRGAVSLEELPRALAVIERSVRTQLGLIEDVLDLARLSTDKLELTCERLDLAQSAERVVELHMPVISKKDLRLVMSRPEGVVPILADRKRLEQVLGNLVGNAVKFTPSGGTIEVRVRAEGDVAVLEVVDSGLGIDPEALSEVFERHAQDDTATRGSGGLGLGLFIVKKLVELHGGAVSASSPGLGCGATFEVRIPLRPGDVAASEEAARPAFPTGIELAGTHVLVVDDDVDTRQVICLILEAHGAAVSLAANLQEAQSSVASAMPDVVLTDLGLPGGTGFELAKAIHARAPELPCIALSGYAGEADGRRATEAGFTRFLTKPVSVPTLVGAVQDAAPCR